MADTEYLLHRGLIESVPLGKSRTVKMLRQRIDDSLADAPNNDPNVSVVIRVFNEAAKLEQVFADLDNQIYSSAVEVVVVDNGSADNSAEVAKAHGAVVVTLPQSEFTYPKSLNVGVEAASNDVVLVTVAHIRLSNIYNLHAGARHFTRNDKTAGVFGTCLPNEGASWVERWSAAGDPTLFLGKSARAIKDAGMGALGATGAMISKAVWRELGGFPDAYQAGGEDTALAKMMLEAGYTVIQEPALTVHHSHGLGLKDTYKQFKHQQEILKAPQQFDRTGLLERRPDLRANRSDSAPEN